MRLKYLLILLALPLLAQQDARTGLKLSGIPARDPSILADSDSRTYYLYTSTETPDAGVVSYKSKDLANWEGPVLVLQALPRSWANPTQGVRHPEVHAYRGKYYLLETLSNSEQVIKKPPESWPVRPWS